MIENFNVRIIHVKDGIFDLKDRNFEITQSYKSKDKRIKKNKECLHKIWDTIKQPNIHVIDIPEEKENEKGIENQPKRIVEKISQVLKRDIIIQIERR